MNARGRTWVSADALLKEDTALTPPEGGVVVSEDRPKRSITDLYPEWYFLGACRDEDETKFFGNEDIAVRPSLTLTDLKSAQTICGSCPVFRQCITHALTLPEEYGVWGGTSRNMRLRILKAAETGLIRLSDMIEELCKAQERIRNRV